ncbi:MAG: diguanylate cyclase, partial [Candidatus Solibacter sp.]|nr:diguanylate cyclase [Candidatus Solibacter sp.]
MISIRSSMTEIERCHQLRAAVLDSYLLAIKNIANYAVELDQEITAPHRKYLKQLADEIATDKPESLTASSASLRGLLRDYRDKAAEYLCRLRDELSGTARALEEILDALSQSDSDHETTLRSAVLKLREAAVQPSGAAIAPLVQAATNSIDQSIEQMRKQHQLTISQFMVEIRMLHKRIDSLEAAAATDEFTRFSSHQETVERIRSTPPGTYSLLLIGARGLRRAEVQFGDEVGSELAGAFAKRLRNSLPATCSFGRWGAEEFVVMLTMTKSEAMASGK